MGIVLALKYGCIRFVAVYCPHAGFQINDLEMVYLDLCSLARDAKHKNIKFVVGGDFNTQIDDISLGDLLSNFLKEYILLAANTTEPYEKSR